MAKSADYKPFPGVVCEYLRNLRISRAKALVDRDLAFDQRDQLRYQISKMREDDPKRTAKEAECFRVEEHIRELAATLKYLEGEKDRAVEEADEGKLWSSAKVEIPTEVLAPKEPKAAKGDDGDHADEQDDPDQTSFDARPVGEAGTPAPVKSDEPLPKRKRGRPRKNVDVRS